MSNFEDREKAHESKFVHDAKMGFEAEARASKLFGLWAASQIGLSGEDANSYAIEVVGANLEEAGFNDILRKVRRDFEAKGLTISDHTIDAELKKAIAEAQKQIKG